MGDKVLNDTSYGTLKHVSNEVLIDGKRHIVNQLENDSVVMDPPAYRGGAPADQRSLVKFSGDILDGNSRNEVVLMQFKQTEGADNHVAGRGGEFYLGLARENAGSTDDAMVDCIVGTVKDGFHFKVPIYAPNLNAGAGTSMPPADARISAMWAPDGYTVTQQNSGYVDAQGVRQPGVFTTYLLARPFDIRRFKAIAGSGGPVPVSDQKWEGLSEAQLDGKPEPP